MRGLRLWRRRGGTRAACSIGRGEASSTVCPHTGRVLKRVRGAGRRDVVHMRGMERRADRQSRRLIRQHRVDTERTTDCLQPHASGCAERMTQLARG